MQKIRKNILFALYLQFILFFERFAFDC